MARMMMTAMLILNVFFLPTTVWPRTYGQAVVPVSTPDHGLGADLYRDTGQG